jgi:hypothetical protein
MLVLLIEGIYEVTTEMWHDMHTKFHEDWYLPRKKIDTLLSHTPSCIPK